jgi:GT2 family glycosyltransferase
MISVIIPHFYGLEQVDRALRECVESMRGHDEIIILANDGIGYGAACNLGMRMARGDFIILSNNDCILKYGTLRDLQDKNYITVPDITPEPKDALPRAFFCIPRNIYERIYDASGDFFDERFEGGYWEDDDLHKRMKELGISSRIVDSVGVHHLNGGGMTMKQIGEQSHFDDNQRRYDEKWSNS